ncbi:MAG: radical SAM protein [Candidatus Dormibacteria bacterium]
MAQFLMLNPSIVINSVDLSNHCDMCTLEEVFADIDTTAFGATAKTRLPGLGDHKFTAEFQQDFAAASVEATIGPLVGQTAAVTVKAQNSATSTTNPAYSFTVAIIQWKPLDGKVGDLAKASIVWPVSGAVTKATS